MPKPKLDKPSTPLAQLLEQARHYGLSVQVVRDPNEWPLWAPDHPYWHDSCEKKSPYLYVEGAISEALAVFRLRGLRLRVYACPLGLHYHLTKSEQWFEADPGPARRPRLGGNSHNGKNKRRSK